MKKDETKRTIKKKTKRIFKIKKTIRKKTRSPKTRAKGKPAVHQLCLLFLLFSVWCDVGFVY